MRIMKFAEVLDESLEIVKKNAGTILMFNLLYGLIYIGVSIIAGVSAVFTIDAIAVMPGSNRIGVFVLLGVLVFIFVVFGLSQIAGNIRIGAQKLNEEKVDFKSAFGTAFKKLPTLAGILLVYALCIGPLAAIAYQVVDESYYLFPFFMDEWVNVTVILIIMLIMIFLMAIVTNFFVFAIHVTVVENLGPIKSIKRSFQLVRTQFWKVFGSMFLMQLLVGAIQYSLISFIVYCGGILYVIGQLLTFAPEGLYQIAFVLVPYLQWPVNIMSYLFLTPMVIIMTTLLYINIRFKTEGFDLVLNIKQLERNMERAE